MRARLVTLFTSAALASAALACQAEPQAGPQAGRPDGTASRPSPAATPTPSRIGALPSDAPPAPLVGRARVTDPRGDVLDEAGATLTGAEPAADLRAVELVGDGASLQVTFEVEGPIPRAASSLVWSLEIRLQGEPAYTVTAQLVGGRMFTGVFDWESGAQDELPAPEVRGAALTLVVDASLLGRVDGPFAWAALTQLDGGYEDTVPDGLSEGAPFPGD